MEMEEHPKPAAETTTGQTEMTKATEERQLRFAGGVRGSIEFIGEDLLQNILARLPALSFASAACVSRSWNLVCDRLLSRPKLSAAFSLNPSLQVAAEEVVRNVLLEPIRPHFAIVSVGPSFDLQQAHQLISSKLGSKTPIITSVPSGIIGRDALSNEFKEIQWEVTEDEDEGPDAPLNINENANRAIALTVGFVPGLKVDIIPLLKQNKEQQVPMIDEFVKDIRARTLSVSGCMSPAAIIMFGDCGTGLKPVLEKMDYAMSPETVIVGDASCQYLYRSDSANSSSTRNNFISAAVALVFARDRDKPRGIGETQFYAALSHGLSPIGPTYKAASVREKRGDCLTWLTARREGLRENLDGQTIISQVFDELGDRMQFPTFYIGVTKRRKCSIASEKKDWITSQTFHEVLGDNQEYLFVADIGIKTGDCFRFYHSDASVALSSCSTVSGRMKRDFSKNNPQRPTGNAASPDKREVIGGIIFSCCGRGEPLFGQTNVDSSPILENFPGVTVAGSFCGGEIGRGSSYSQEESQGNGSVRCCLHVYSTVYLVLSYTPASA